MTSPTTPQPDGERAQARLDTLRMIAADRMWTQEEFSEACDCVTAGATFKHPASLIARTFEEGQFGQVAQSNVPATISAGGAGSRPALSTTSETPTSPALTQAVEAAAREVYPCPQSEWSEGEKRANVASQARIAGIILRHLTPEWQRVLEVTEDQLRQKNETLRRGSAAMARMSQDNADLRAQLAAAKADGERPSVDELVQVAVVAAVKCELVPRFDFIDVSADRRDKIRKVVVAVMAAIDAARAQSAGAKSRQTISQ